MYAVYFYAIFYTLHRHVITGTVNRAGAAIKAAELYPAPANRKGFSICADKQPDCYRALLCRPGFAMAAGQ
jgi:hypothetical protein